MTPAKNSDETWLSPSLGGAVRKMKIILSVLETPSPTNLTWPLTQTRRKSQSLYMTGILANTISFIRKSPGKQVPVLPLSRS